jgi:hypothetical protein
MVADLRPSIPFRFRTYDSRDKTWMVEPAYADLAIELLLKHFPDAEVPRRPRTSRTAAAETDGDAQFQVFHLLPTAPPELVRAAYRTLAKIFHPDKGGGAEIMRRLTETHDALVRRLSA